MNGATMTLDEGCTIETLIEGLSMEDRPCAVEVNRGLVRTSDRGTVVLAEGDTVEIVTLVGGG